MFESYDEGFQNCDTTSGSGLVTPFSVKDILNMNMQNEFYAKKDHQQQMWENHQYFGTSDQIGSCYYNSDDTATSYGKNGWNEGPYSDILPPHMTHIQQFNSMYTCNVYQEHREQGYEKIESPSKYCLLNQTDNFWFLPKYSE